MQISDLFNPNNAKSKGFVAHQEGNIRFISNGFYNNGVVGYVTPLNGERVFDEKAICVSSFCEATIQEPPFLPRGNGGSGLIVLTPKEEMNNEELYYYAALINKLSWRFCYGRMIIPERLMNLTMPKKPKGFSHPVAINELMPRETQKQDVKVKKFKEYALTGLCEIDRRYAPYLNELNVTSQSTPYVTTTEHNNGIELWCNEDALFHKGQITISLDGTCGTAFYQFDDFIAGEKTAVLSLKRDNNPYLLFYIATVIRIRSWRYHYGRKLSMDRLHKLTIPIPVDDKEFIDNKAIKIIDKKLLWFIYF